MVTSISVVISCVHVGFGGASAANASDGPSPTSLHEATQIENENAVVGEIRGATYSIHSLAFSPDGKYLAAGGGDLDPGRALNPQGERLGSGEINVWHLMSRQLRRRFETGHNYSIVDAITFSPDGVQLVSGNWNANIGFWELETGKLTMELKGHASGRPSGSEHVFRHAVKDVVFVPKSDQLASASWDRSIKFWDPRTGKETATIKHANAISLAFSPDGRRMVSIGQELNLWDVGTRRKVKKLASQQNNSQATVAYSSDDKWFVSAGLGDLTIWNSRTGRKQHILGKSGGCVVVSRDNKWIVSGGQLLRVWEASTAKPVRTIEQNTNCIALSPDGKLLATSSKRTIRLWDTSRLFRFGQDGQHAISFSREAFQFTGVNPSFTLGGDQILADDDHYDNKNIRVWSRKGKRELRAIPVPPRELKSRFVSDDGKYLAAHYGSPKNDLNDQLRLIHFKTGRLKWTSKWTRNHTLEDVKFSGARYVVASLSRFEGNDQTKPRGEVRIIDIKSGKTARSLSFERLPKQVEVSPDEELIVIASSVRTSHAMLISVFELTSGRLLNSWETDYQVKIAISTDSRQIATFGSDRTLQTSETRLWSPMDGQVRKTLAAQMGDPCDKHAVEFTQDGRCIVTATDDSIVVSNVATGGRVARFRSLVGGFRTIDVSPDSQWIVSGGGDRVVSVWAIPRPENGKQASREKPDGSEGERPHESRIWTSSDGKYSVAATLIRVNAGNVYLKKEDGSTIQVPLPRLSEKDQQYLRARFKED